MGGFFYLWRRIEPVGSTSERPVDVCLDANAYKRGAGPQSQSNIATADGWSAEVDRTTAIYTIVTDMGCKPGVS